MSDNMNKKIYGPKIDPCETPMYSQENCVFSYIFE